jgi:hypothetical protein
MTVDQAQQTVDRMAKRASAKASKSLWSLDFLCVRLYTNMIQEN